MTKEEATQILRTRIVPTMNWQEIHEAIDITIEALSADTEWIPCSERLPEKNKEVLISCDWGVDIGEYGDDGWRSEWINHYDDDAVLAWMPLPKPYKGGDEK